MMIRITTEPTHSDRARRRRLAIYLSLLLMPLTVVAIAQSPETTETQQEQSTEVPPDVSLESGSSCEGCPCCGQRGRGQAGGRGWQGSGRGQGRAGQARTVSQDPEITDIDGGVEVTETSEDEQVTKLIRAHAIKVEEFVARGLAAYQEETPLPAGYSDASP